MSLANRRASRHGSGSAERVAAGGCPVYGDATPGAEPPADPAAAATTVGSPAICPPTATGDPTTTTTSPPLLEESAGNTMVAVTVSSF